MSTGTFACASRSATIHAFGAAEDDDPQLEFARQIQRRLDVARPVGSDEQRQLAVEHRLQRFEVQAAGGERRASRALS